MMSFIINDNDILFVAQFSADAAYHFVWRFGERIGLAALQQALRESARGDSLSWFESMKIGDDDFGAIQVGLKFQRHNVELAIVVVGVVGQQHPQPIADGNAGRDDQKGVTETRVLSIGNFVENVPGDEHRHHHSFAAAGGHFKCDTKQQRVGLFVGITNFVFDPGVAVFVGDFGQIDGRFQRFNLAEKQSAFAIRPLPVFEESGAGFCDAHVAAASPASHPLANLVDEFVFLNALLCPLGFKSELPPFLFGFCDGDEIRTDSPLALVEKVESLHVKQRQSELELENLFNSLMQRAFRGELVAVAKQLLNSTDRHAAILGKVIKAHEPNPKWLATLGHVKGEKICHVIENALELDLGRTPYRLAAGPVDFKHLNRVEHRAKMKRWFSTKNRDGGLGKEYKSEKNLQYLLKNLTEELGEIEDELNRIIKLFLPMDTERAEVVATVYAAWNDLLLDRRQPSDDAIVTEARENWTEQKLKIERENFFKSIEWLRRNNLAPSGRGKHTVRFES